MRALEKYALAVRNLNRTVIGGGTFPARSKLTHKMPPLGGKMRPVNGSNKKRGTFGRDLALTGAGALGVGIAANS